MVGSQKILTVSYGTFSCTLEGFEDSFATMKAIAEYFRDLAADDRYFGAEPPQPDAETLQRIAQREVARRVEARMEGAGLVLRVDDSVAGSLGVDGASRASAVAEARPPAPAMPPRPAAPAAGLAPARAPERPAERPPVAARGSQDDGVAAKLARIRAVVGRAALASAEEEPARADVVAPELSEDAPASAPQAGGSASDGLNGAALGGKGARRAIGAGASDRRPAFPVEAPEPAPEAWAAPQGETPREGRAAPEPTPEAAPEPVASPAAEDGAEVRAVEGRPAAVALDPGAEAEARRPVTLTRPRVIRLRRDAPEPGVMAGPEPDAPAGAAKAEPAASGAALLLSPEAEAALLAELAALAGRQGAPVAEPEGDDAAAVAVAGFMARLHDGGVAANLAPLADEAESLPLDGAPGSILGGEPDAQAEALLAAVAGAAREVPAEAAAAVPEVAGDALEALSGTGREAGAAFVPANDPEPSAEPSPEATAETSLEAASEVAPAPASNAAHEAVAVGASNGWAATRPAGDVVEARAEAAPATPVNGSAGLGPLVLTADAARPRARAGSPGADDAAVARLLSRADAQLAEPEASRRREALAQLRAAVAATEAARRLGEEPAPAARREDAFRDDLRQAVRPRRPASGDARGELRSDRPRPAPLKLVASQRVDLGPEGLSPVPVRPVRPRRVAVGAAPAVEAEDAPAPAATAPDHGARGSFAAFAAEMGAVSLTDVLEAAAAFTSFVEGAEDFSRPQIIDRAREEGAAEFSREDGLRSFGTLLRQGTITRVRGGRFQVAGESRFNPARRAG